MLFVVVKEKGRDKGKGKDNGKKKKDSQDAGSSDTGSRSAGSSQQTSTSEGKPHNINELGATGSGLPQSASQQVSTLTVSGRAPEEHVYIWMLAQPSTHIQELMLLDSGVALSACRQAL